MPPSRTSRSGLTTCSFTILMRSYPDSSQTMRLISRKKSTSWTRNTLRRYVKNTKKKGKKWWLVSQCLRYRDRSSCRKNSMQRFSFELRVPRTRPSRRGGEKTCIRLTLRRIQAKTPSKNLMKRGEAPQTHNEVGAIPL